MNGYLLVFLSAVLYGVEPTILELAVDRGMVVTMVSAMVYTLVLTGFSLAGLVRRESFRVGRRQLFSLLLLGILSGGTNILLASAYAYMPVGCATVMHFLYPTLTCLTMVLCFGARLMPLRLAAMGCSLAGLMLVSGGVMQGSPVGILLALGSSFTYAAYVVLTDRFAGLTQIPMPVRMFYISAGALITCAMGFAAHPDPGRFTGEATALVVVRAVMIAGAMAFFARGIDRVGGTSASFFSLFEPLTSLVVSTLVLSYRLRWTTMLGCCLILLAVLFVSLSDGHTQGKKAA